MVAEIQYKSYLVRLWYGGRRVNPDHVPVPEAAVGPVPPWLARALSSEQLDESAPREQYGGEPNDVHAEVEHIQTGERLTFDAIGELLDFLRAQTGDRAKSSAPARSA